MIRASAWLILLAACTAPATSLVAGDSTSAGDATPDSDVLDAPAGPDAEAAVDAVLDAGADAQTDAATPPGTGFTPDFRGWLNSHGYSGAGLERDDLAGGSFGGRTFPNQPLTHDPVVFIHGNSDKALGDQAGQTGWTASRAWFLAHGYTDAELYATTWGPADAAQSSAQTHSQANVKQVRQLLEAVLAYTQAQHVDVIAHSMGVTLARKAILGGQGQDPGGQPYNLGPPLTGQVDAFVGIAGANLGIAACFVATSSPTCNAVNGFYPGELLGGQVVNRSAFLDGLLAAQGYEGQHVYSLWSLVDEILPGADLVYGQPTSRIPGQEAEITFQAPPYGHFGLKDLTADQQLQLVRDHHVP